MVAKTQLFTKRGQQQDLPEGATPDEWGVFRVGVFEVDESIEGEVDITGITPSIGKFTGTVLTVNDEGRIETFRTTSPNKIIPELSGEVDLVKFDSYRITSID
jgi:hypothetical protein